MVQKNSQNGGTGGGGGGQRIEPLGVPLCRIGSSRAGTSRWTANAGQEAARLGGDGSGRDRAYT
ncbi:MAG: hypothetical protein NTY03_03740 [Candidatus Bathyarchaeota archaeon]|nr:hypothetical protein [Candidatus Bathyarchaeota archaeon]